MRIFIVSGILRFLFSAKIHRTKLLSFLYYWKLRSYLYQDGDLENVRPIKEWNIILKSIQRIQSYVLDCQLSNPTIYSYIFRRIPNILTIIHNSSILLLLFFVSSQSFSPSRMNHQRPPSLLERRTKTPWEGTTQKHKTL